MMSVAAVDMCLLGKLVMNLLKLLLMLCIHVQYLTLCYAFAFEKASLMVSMQIYFAFLYIGYLVRLDILDPRHPLVPYQRFTRKRNPANLLRL